MSEVSPIPQGHGTLTPHITLTNAADAIEFYKKAFGAKELSRLPGPKGLVMHAELDFGGSILMLCDEFPGSETNRAPKNLGGTTATMHIWTDDVDALFERAVKAGARVEMSVRDMFWGDRYATLYDPFGHKWGLAQRIANLTPDQMLENAAEVFSNWE